MGKDNRAVEYLCRLREAGSALLDPFNDSIIKAAKNFWTGTNSRYGKYFGKITIITSALMIVIANINTLTTSSAKKKQVVDAALINDVKQKLRNKSLMNTPAGGKHNG